MELNKPTEEEVLYDGLNWQKWRSLLLTFWQGLLLRGEDDIYIRLK
jgi:hypothetical protein